MGFPWRRFGEVLKAVGPTVALLIPGMPAVLVPVVIHAIDEAQAIPGASGAEKKAHVLNIVNDALATADSVGKPIGDAAVIVPAVSAATDAVISTVNAVKAAHPPEPKP